VNRDKARIILLFAIQILFLGWLPKLLVEEVSWYQNNDFAHYYITGDLVRNGINPYPVDLSPLYLEYGFTPDRMISKATNPPSLAYLTSLLTYFRPEVAFYVWSGIQVAALAFGIFLSIRVAGLVTKGVENFFIILAGMVPLSFFSHIRFAQSQALIMFLIAGSLLLIKRGGDLRRNLGALGMGFASGLKIFTLPIVIPIFTELGIVGVGWFCIGFAALWVPFLIGVGPKGVEDFVTIAMPYISSVAHNFTGNIGFVGSLVNSFRVMGELDGIRPFISLLNQISIIILGLALIYVFSRAAKGWALEYSLTFTLGLCCLFSPVSWNHYLVLLLPGLILIFKECSQRDFKSHYTLFFALTYLILGSTVGLLSAGDPITRIISAWSGFAGITFYLLLQNDIRAKSVS